MFSFFRNKTKDEQLHSGVAKEPVTIAARVKNIAWVEEMERLVPNEAERPVTEVLVGDIYVAYGVDLGDSYRLLTPNMIEAMGLQSSQLGRAAVPHLLRASEVLRRKTLGPIIEFAHDDDMVAPLMLLTVAGLHLQIELGESLVGIFPYAYSAFIARANEEGVAAIRDRISNEMPLSGLMYQCKEGRWSVRES